MTAKQAVLKQMPDIASEAQADVAGQLDWVGMGEIEMPVMIQGDQGAPILTPAYIDAFVDLAEAEARGIHMSRLYLTVDEMLGSEPLSPGVVERVLERFMASHEALSTAGQVRIRFDHMVRRRALESDNSGWRRYPICVTGTMRDGEIELELEVDVVYSSTCPCSAALARQLIQEQFDLDFPAGQKLDRQAVYEWLGSEQGIVATPHSQRSTAEVKVKLRPMVEHFDFVALIDVVENALQTPVQTAVKRADEQAFALLNGRNLMFCEDAGRRVQAALTSMASVADFTARCSHFESLHPHDAVSVVSKGVPGGYGDPKGRRQA